MSDVRTHFDALAATGSWDDLYDGPETAHNTSFRVRLQVALDLIPAEARRVVDVGCGPAPLAAGVTARGASYVGLDDSREMIARARRRAPAARLLQGTLPLPFRDASFDAVVALGFVEYLPDIPASLREMGRITRPGGVVIVSTPKKWHLDVLTIGLLSPFRRLAAGLWGKRSDSIPRTLLQAADLDRLAVEAGLRPDGGRHYHYTPMPYPLTVVAAGVAYRVNRRAESRLDGRAPFFAHGYVGRYRRA